MMKLSYYINFILNLENVPLLTEQEAFGIDGFDTAILMLDDIHDQSKIRDGKPCFYLTHGIENTEREAKILQQKSFQTLNIICDNRKIGFVGRLRAKFLLSQLHSAIIRGENIDTCLERSEKINYSLVSKYDEMIRLFTGGHIKYAFLLGYLFSQKNPPYKNKVVSIGEKFGIIRQMVDDLKDYKEEHHEPLGDLMNHKKRLPELTFLLNSTDEEKNRLNDLLKNPEENFLEIRKTVLNKKVNNLVSEKIQQVRESAFLDIQKVPKNYQENLEKLLSIFLKPLSDFS